MSYIENSILIDEGNNTYIIPLSIRKRKTQIYERGGVNNRFCFLKKPLIKLLYSL